MEFYKTHLFVTCLLFLSSSCFGDQGSPNKRSTKLAEQHRLLKYWIKRQVPTGPDAKPSSVLDDPANYESKRQVPTGPNPLHHFVQPHAGSYRSKSSTSLRATTLQVLDDPANYESKRQVPTGPNPLHHFVQPPVEVLDELQNYDLNMRLVPSGHEESPEEPPSKVYTPPPPSSRANYDLMRLVPSGPNHEESPEELPSPSSATEANVHRKPHSRRLLDN
ncbi:mitochondrial distribution and morphology protein 34-like [Pyrus ussuriensis x Pyrus communis]|uniref:Mitochondrial distribution and morphology protein 34-like n=1 Tax=Pyrus ussuriensis x Pyrus communis TaxID=2448454 RepID=A0A5N5H4Q7_9ROSA|nr:mitochondrial distribution and morphology protein 34-like [Pyrus ussuriensis x Pyrus communis]